MHNTVPVNSSFAYFVFWTTSNCAQGLYLALLSVITPEGAQGILCGAVIKSQVGCPSVRQERYLLYYDLSGCVLNFIAIIT